MLLFYNFWLRFSSLFNPKKNPGRFFGLVLAVFFAALYGFLFGYLFGSDDWEEANLASKENFLMGVAFFFFFTTILRGFYPNYKQLGTWVRPFFPLSKFQRYNLKLSADFASSFFLPAIAFILLFCFRANAFLGWRFVLKFIIILLAANIVRRMIQATIEFKLQKRGALFLIIPFCIASLIVLQISSPIYAPSPIWSDILTLFLIYTAGLVIEEYLPIERKVEVQTVKRKTNIITSLLFKNKKVRTAILVGMLFKVGLLASDAIVFYTSGSHFSSSETGLWLFVSPVMVFNSVFNNTWGYYRELWLTIDKSPNAGNVLQSYFFKLLLPLLALDFIISFVYLLFFRPDWFNIGLLSWITLAITFSAFGFYWSILKPKLVLKTISSKGNTYIWSNLLNLFFIMLLYGMLLTSWLYWLVPIYLIVAILVFYYSKKEYSELRKAIYLELFKD